MQTSVNWRSLHETISIEWVRRMWKNKAAAAATANNAKNALLSQGFNSTNICFSTWFLALVHIFACICSPFAYENKRHWLSHSHRRRRCYINSHFHGNSAAIMTSALQSTYFRLFLTTRRVSVQICPLFLFFHPRAIERTTDSNARSFAFTNVFCHWQTLFECKCSCCCCFSSLLCQRFMLHMWIFFNLNGAFIIHSRVFRVNFHVILHIKSW